MTGNEGKIIIHKFESSVLKSNPLKDPYSRDIIVYIPPNYSQSQSKGFPAAIGLSGFGGNGRSLFNLDPLSENVEQRMNRLIYELKSLNHIFVRKLIYSFFAQHFH